MPKKKTTEQFINDAIKVHGNRYDYSKVSYEGNDKKVCIICPEHGEFWQTPSCHLQGSNCCICGNNKKKSRGDFIDAARNVHGNKYDYSKVKYSNNKTKVRITCPKHGDFTQTPNSHLLGHGCPSCSNENKIKRQTRTFETFVSKANKLHKNKYIYHKGTYINTKHKTLITCPIHGDFEQTVSDHLGGHGCPKCNCLWKDTNMFIKEARKVHGDKYDYSKVNYVNKLSILNIICPTHGEFKQIAQNHLKGCNCPKCTCSKIEGDVMRALREKNIKFDYIAHFDWLGNQHLDFYLPQYNVAIECQGIQHFEPRDIFGGEKDYNDNVKRDKRKKTLCENNNIKLLYYTNLKQYTTFLDSKLFKNTDDLIKEFDITENEK